MNVRPVGIDAVALLIGTVGALLLATGCGGPSPSTSEPLVSDRAGASRCDPAGKVLVDTINASLVVTNGRLEDAFMVKSADFEDVYFVAGEVQGQGMVGREIGVWVTRDPLVQTHQVLYSINGVASAVSDWPPGGLAKPPLGMSSDGAAEAAACVP